MAPAGELFEVAASTPPPAAWLARHDLIVRDYQNRHTGGWDYNGLNTDRFLCANRAMTRYASGETQDVAEQNYCALHGLEWWKLAEWNGAMADMPPPVAMAGRVNFWKPTNTVAVMEVE